MKCHVNVEICASIKSIKYVLKYVHKGADQANFQLQQGDSMDEISHFQNARHIGSTEAAWGIFEMSHTERYPPVKKSIWKIFKECNLLKPQLYKKRQMFRHQQH